MAKDNDLHDLLTPKEVADLLRVSVRCILSWTRQGRIPAIRFGAGGQRDPVRFQRQAIHRLIDDKSKADAFIGTLPAGRKRKLFDNTPPTRELPLTID